jgi:hypothetical protein
VNLAASQDSEDFNCAAAEAEDFVKDFLAKLVLVQLVTKLLFYDNQSYRCHKIACCFEAIRYLFTKLPVVLKP